MFLSNFSLFPVWAYLWSTTGLWQVCINYHAKKKGYQIIFSQLTVLSAFNTSKNIAWKNCSVWWKNTTIRLQCTVVSLLEEKPQNEKSQLEEDSLGGGKNKKEQNCVWSIWKDFFFKDVALGGSYLLWITSLWVRFKKYLQSRRRKVNCFLHR